MDLSDSSFLRMRGIKKEFPGVLALDNVDIDLNKGEVLALVGENGAGKSTLMKVLAGIYKPDAGEIIIDGQVTQISDALDSYAKGIAIVHQELNLIPNLSIAENLFLGRDISSYGIMQHKELHKLSKSYMDRVGLQDFDPKAPLESLSIAHQQMVEIAKALSINAKILILDEPTSSLTDQESFLLFEIIKKISEEGTSIIYISHRMEEIFSICNRITVMRDGQFIGTKKTEDTSASEIINMMVGRDIGDLFPKEQIQTGDVRLKVSNLSAANGRANNVSFEIRKGEVFGISGLVGAGRTEMVRALFGIDKRSSGSIEIDGESVLLSSPGDSIKAGIGFVPEDRKEQALVLGMTIRENISLCNLKNFVKVFSINRKQEQLMAGQYIEKLRIKTPSEEQIVKNLSGGNQQKVVISKWLNLNPKILILDEPTRGIDVNSKREIYLIINELVRNDVAIILISSDMPEIVGMSDRVLVMHEGEVMGLLEGKDIEQSKIMHTALKGQETNS